MVPVTEQRTAQDFARPMKGLVADLSPEAEVVRVGLDNLPPQPAALYQSVDPAEARRLTRKLGVHATPKHARWLNMVEIEFSLRERQWLNRRLPDIESVRREVRVWGAVRTVAKATVEWRFTTADAREQFYRFYPKVQ